MLKAGYYAGAVLQGHYAVEIAVKRYIARSRGLSHLQKAYQTHDLKQLLHAAGLYDEAVKGSANRRRGEAIVLSSHPAPASAAQNWKIALRYSESEITKLRYVSPSVISEEDARMHFEAVSMSPNGLIPWLDRRT